VSSEHLFVLVVRHISELIDSESVVDAVLLIVGGIVVVVLLEEGESVVIFLFGAISSVVFGNEVNESLLGLADGVDGKEVGARDWGINVQQGKGGNSASNGDGTY